MSAEKPIESRSKEAIEAAEQGLLRLYMGYINEALGEIREGSRPSIEVIFLSGTRLPLNHEALQFRGPQPRYVLGYNSLTRRTDFINLDETLGGIGSNILEAANFYHQLISQKPIPARQAI